MPVGFSPSDLYRTRTPRGREPTATAAMVGSSSVKTMAAITTSLSASMEPMGKFTS